MKVNGQILLDLGAPEGPCIGLLIEIINTQFGGLISRHHRDALKSLFKDPDFFVDHPVFSDVAKSLIHQTQDQIISLKEKPLPYAVYGISGIEEGALNQMDIALRLPISVGGALMADAHQGYGLPIGGVLATKNEIIPYGVGNDIGCRMCLSIYDLPVNMLESHSNELKEKLIRNTKFGTAAFDKPKDHEVLENSLFSEIKFLKTLKHKAFQQIGTSGGGNHFVEFGIVELIDPENEFQLPSGQYLSLLSHSGSRGFGAKIAQHYTTLAKELCPLPREAKHLAWLDLDTEAGQEYWLAMNLAGAYASACHHQIHERIAKALQTRPIATVENHHNFAWKEKDISGQEVIVHRKGATPAGKGVLGVIPGSMTAPGYIVRGKGDLSSLSSAAHGAGRAMSRKKAKLIFDKKEVSQYLIEKGVELIGAGLDEAPMAYKNIHDVMEAQIDLVETVGTFLPKIVRMCGDQSFHEVD
jgi:tRNA-splicing ligase RtcB